jgi:1-acyl-sn-glycerol-3-phosphate acyltransferase
MGDNLVRGKFFQALSKKTGLFLIKRPTTRREIVESATMLKKHIMNLLAHGVDSMVYPEGTRRNIPDKGAYGSFFSTVFDPVLEYEKNKEEILSQNKELRLYNSYIVPFNLDYYKVMEAREITRNIGDKPRTLHILDFLKMIRHIGPVYVTFGEPIKIADHLDKDRKQLAEYTRQKCLELVKILPINIVSCAILDAYENGAIKTNEIFTNIRATIEKLKPLEDRFRGFGSEEDPADIMKKVTVHEKNFEHIDVDDLKLYRLYASYIRHYFENRDNPLDKLDKLDELDKLDKKEGH